MNALALRQVEALDFKFEPKIWDFSVLEAKAVAAHWDKRKAENPRLFNGRILLSHRHEFDPSGAALRGAFMEVDFSAFLAWRDFGFPDLSVCNCFSMSALQTREGAFVLGEMAPHTANAGQIYFAAGTPDAKDIVGDRVDLFRSARRELKEETGVAAAAADYASGWTIVYAPPRIACIKRVQLDIGIDQMRARIDAFLAADGDAELGAVHFVRSRADIAPDKMPPFIAAYLRDVLG